MTCPTIAKLQRAHRLVAAGVSRGIAAEHTGLDARLVEKIASGEVRVGGGGLLPADRTALRRAIAASIARLEQAT